MSKNFSMYGLPETVKFCKLCVNSNQKPNTVVEFKNNDNQKKGTGIDENNILLNLASIEHDPEEVISVDLNKISYEW